MSRFHAGSKTFSVQVPYRTRTIRTGENSSVTVREVTDTSISVHVDIMCDDSTFKRATNSCSNQVRNLSGAVTAMSAAQTHEIYKTGKEVSKVITDGFFDLVRSEISQQATELENRFESLLGAIHENGKLIDQQRQIMEKDYHRISSRYSQLFQDLDDALDRRIRNLDAPAFNVNEASKNLFGQRFSMSGGAGSAVSAAEDPAFQCKLEIATLRKRILKSIEGISYVLNQEKNYEKYMDAIQFNEALSEAKFKYAPVMTVTAQKLDAEEEYNAFQAPEYLSDTLGKTIGNRVFSETRDVECHMSEAETEQLNSYFNAESEKWMSQTSNEEAAKNQRILETLNNLWKQNPLT